MGVAAGGVFLEVVCEEGVLHFPHGRLRPNRELEVLSLSAE